MWVSAIIVPLFAGHPSPNDTLVYKEGNLEVYQEPGGLYHGGYAIRMYGRWNAGCYVVGGMTTRELARRFNDKPQRWVKHVKKEALKRSARVRKGAHLVIKECDLLDEVFS